MMRRLAFTVSIFGNARFPSPKTRFLSRWCRSTYTICIWPPRTKNHAKKILAAKSNSRAPNTEPLTFRLSHMSSVVNPRGVVGPKESSDNSGQRAHMHLFSPFSYVARLCLLFSHCRKGWFSSAHPKTGCEVNATWTRRGISLQLTSRIGMAFSQRHLNETSNLTVDIIPLFFLSTISCLKRRHHCPISSWLVLLSWQWSRSAEIEKHKNNF